MSDIYDIHFYSGLTGARQHNEAALWGVFAVLGRPASYLDMGCGDGWLVYTAQTAGVHVSMGVELSDSAVKVSPPGTQIAVYDLATTCDLGHGFDLVTSWEVGEHLPEEAADTYVYNLARHTSKYLVFTAARKGQGGYYHINCQDQEYWREKITDAGLQYDVELTNQLQAVWTWVVGPLRYLVDNVQVFVRP